MSERVAVFEYKSWNEVFEDILALSEILRKDPDEILDSFNSKMYEETLGPLPSEEIPWRSDGS